MRRTENGTESGTYRKMGCQFSRFERVYRLDVQRRFTLYIMCSYLTNDYHLVFCFIDILLMNVYQL